MGIGWMLVRKQEVPSLFLWRIQSMKASRQGELVECPGAVGTSSVSFMRVDPICPWTYRSNETVKEEILRTRINIYLTKEICLEKWTSALWSQQEWQFLAPGSVGEQIIELQIWGQKSPLIVLLMLEKETEYMEYCGVPGDRSFFLWSSCLQSSWLPGWISCWLMTIGSHSFKGGIYLLELHLGWETVPRRQKSSFPSFVILNASSWGTYDSLL